MILRLGCQFTVGLDEGGRNVILPLGSRLTVGPSGRMERYLLFCANWVWDQTSDPPDWKYWIALESCGD